MTDPDLLSETPTERLEEGRARLLRFLDQQEDTCHPTDIQIYVSDSLADDLALAAAALEAIVDGRKRGYAALSGEIAEAALAYEDAYQDGWNAAVRHLRVGADHSTAGHETEPVLGCDTSLATHPKENPDE